jgi:hypothetical protein
MDISILILLIAGAIFFLIAGLNAVARYNFVAFGLLCWIITVLITHADKMS